MEIFLGELAETRPPEANGTNDDIQKNSSFCSLTTLNWQNSFFSMLNIVLQKLRNSAKGLWSDYNLL